MALTDRQQAFVFEYVKDWNATQAAIRAGYSADTARSIGHENLTKPDIRREIDLILKERGLTADRVIAEQMDIAFSDMGDFVDIDDGGGVSYRPSSQLKGKTKLIKKIKEKRKILSSGEGDGQEVVIESTIEFELYDRQKALDVLSKHFGIGGATEPVPPPQPIHPINQEDAEKLKEECRTDFAKFMRHFFKGHFWGDFSPMHQDVIELEKKPDRRGVLEVTAAPRGNAKTVFRVLAKVIHSIVYGYHPFTVIIGYSAQEAEGKVKDIRDELLFNEELTRVYGQMLNKGAGTQSFISKNNCMVLARGRGGQVRGLRHGLYRPTHIICDDVEELEACQSQLQREKTLHWFQKDVMPAGQSGEEYKLDITFVGTVLHEESLLATLLKDPSWTRKKYRAVESWAERQDLWEQWKELYCNLDDESSVQTAKAFFEANQEEMLKGTKVLWADNVDESYYGLMVQRLKLGQAAFSSEKQNEPFDPESQVLDPSLCPRFKIYTPDHPEWLPSLGSEGFAVVRTDTGKAVSSKEMRIIAFMDPALGRKSGKKQTMAGDYAAIVICGQDLSGYIYVLDVWLKKAKPDKQIETAFALHDKWNFETLYLETVGFQELLKDKITLEQAKWAKEMKVVGVGQHHDKQARITSLQPYFENKWLLLAEGLDLEFINQLRLFPTVNDDGPDALEGAVSRLRKPKGFIGTQDRQAGVV
jgi:predicted phage terminase large subunit-like protein